MSFSESQGKSIAGDDFVRGMVRLLVEHYKPRRIYLFGSKARGEAHQDSDYDFLVIVDAVPSRETKVEFHRKRLESRSLVEFPADIVFWTEEGFNERLVLKASLPSTVKREGILLHEAA